MNIMICEICGDEYTIHDLECYCYTVMQGDYEE